MRPACMKCDAESTFFLGSLLILVSSVRCVMSAKMKEGLHRNLGGLSILAGMDAGN